MGCKIKSILTRWLSGFLQASPTRLVIGSITSLCPLLSVRWSDGGSPATGWLDGRFGKLHFHAPIGALVYSTALFNTSF